MEVEYVACVVVEVSVKLWLVHGIFVWFVCVVGKIVPDGKGSWCGIWVEFEKLAFVVLGSMVLLGIGDG